MKRFLFLYLALLLIAPWMRAEPVDYVNVLMGTDSSRDFSAGNTYPAIALPWGMNAWTPVTGKMGSGWQYTYNARIIYGFKQTHQPSPWINDYGQFEVMATCGKPVFSEDKRASWFSHKAEVATPYYYKVYLAEWDVVAEIVPTERAACFRFTFPETQQANIVVDAFDGKARVDVNAEKHEVTGFSVRNSGGVPNNFRNFFVMKLNRSFNVVETEDSKRKGAVITMATRKGEQVELRVASSFISQDQAWRNFKELEDMSFEEIKDKGKDGMRSLEMFELMRRRTSTICAPSILVSTGHCSSRADSMSSMIRECRCITVHIMEKSCLAICTLTRDSGTLSAHCFLFSICSIRLKI